jgi:hypothetical protein
MFSPPVRLLLATLALAFGVWGLMRGEPVGWALMGAAVLLVVGYFRHGTVYAAFRASAAGDQERARNLLAGTRYPHLLGAQDRAYYHWIRGGIAAHDGNAEHARAELVTAAGGALRTDNDRCIVHYQLGEVALAIGNREAAREYLRQAREFRHRPQADELLDSLDERLRTPPAPPVTA